MSYISVITSTLNCGGTLPQLIASLKKQNCRDFEWIAVDGGSTDDTLRCLSECEGIDLRILPGPDSGIADAWNKALKVAKGEWLYFIGGDDYLLSPSTLRECCERLQNVPSSVQVSYGSVVLVNRSGHIVGKSGAPWEQVKKGMRSHMIVSHQAMFHRRALFGRVGHFDTRYRLAADFALLRRALDEGGFQHLPDLPVAAMRLGGVSTSPRNSHLLLRELRSIARANGALLPTAHWMIGKSAACLRTVLVALLGHTRAMATWDALRAVAGRPPFWSLT